MGEKIIVGPIDRGLRNDVTPFNVNNDNFPVLINAYQWRSRLKRKRGTSFLARLTRFFNSESISYFPAPGTINLVAGAANLLTGFSLETNGNIVPGTVTINDITTGDVYTEPVPPDGTLLKNGIADPGSTINYATGAITIAGGGADAISATFIYYPDLPVMGLEDVILLVNQFPLTMGFDTKYSYIINNTFPFNVYDVSFYRNPAVDPINLPGYVPKTFETPTTWNGQDYQQFWTVNYQGALWATNGINVPFTPTNIGMQFKVITNIAIILAGPPATATITIAGHGLVVGDFVFINEVVGLLNGAISTINFQTGYVIAVTDANNVVVEFPFATLAGAYVSGGIAQYLTNRSNTSLDSLRFYDGDPTDGNPTNPSLTGTHGWVNFAPPLSKLPLSIADLPAAIYYLVGARMIIPFKDRLLFIGVVVQQSGGSAIYLQDTVVYSQNGTPYYTASFTGDPSLPTTVFHPILVPINQTATPNAYWADQTGFGGFVTVGVDQAITTFGAIKDVLILGLTNMQVQLVYTGQDIIPFNFYLIDSQLGSSSTFSSLNIGDGQMTRGDRGFVVTNQHECVRFDLDIPDEVFQTKLSENGIERMTAQKDYINEWSYFTYPVNDDNEYKFPTQTLQYNYRDNSWAVFRESYTHYGAFRKQTGFTWATVGTIFPTWAQWNEPWNAGSSTLLEPLVIAGNQQGFVVIRDDGTSESKSLYIRNIAAGIVTSPDHSLSEGDYIIISDVLGTIGAQVNSKIFSVANPITNNSFGLSPPIGTGTYIGSGLIKRMYRPYIQSKQFPLAWSMSRKTRIGAQQYLLSTTAKSQMQLLIFLSQDADNPYNNDPIVPDPNSNNNSLIYSTVLYTCPESTNLGLTPANTNLQTPTAFTQSQIWHRINTSLIGDTVQVGFTLSNDQMRSVDVSGTPFAITGITQANSAVLTTTAGFSPGQLVLITDVVGMIQLNNNYYNILASSPTTITLEVDSTAFSAYVSGGTITPVAPINQFSEIEIHGFILDATPSQVLV